ncbi:MAG: flagellar export chaperone FlgN [Acidimicrobiales bacterium]
MTRGALERLASCLDEQLSALRQLCFKFEVQEIVLSGGRHQWLNETTSELERAVATVQGCDRALRGALSRGAVALGLSPEATVREVAAAAPEPWGYIFGQHREDLQRSIERVAQLSRTNRQLLARGHAATVSAMQFLGADVPSGYDASGSAAPVSGSVGLLDARA